MLFYEKLKDELIVKSSRTVTDAARALAVSRPALSNVLNGNADLSIELALRMEARYGMDAGKLLHSQLDERIARAREARQWRRDDERSHRLPP